MVKNLRRLACKFDLDQGGRKSTQVHARTGQTESQVDPSFQLGSTCDSVWPGLNIDKEIKCLTQKLEIKVSQNAEFSQNREINMSRNMRTSKSRN